MLNNKEIELKLIKHLNDKEIELKNIFDKYVDYIKMYSLIRILIFVVVGVIGIYNVFFAGKRYSLSDYNNIKYTMGTIMGIIACIFMIMAIIAFKKQFKIRKLIKTLALSKNMPYKDLKKEINIVLKSNFGGSGI